VINGIADTVKSASWIGVISPFHWIERTSSGAPGGTFDLGATIGLAVVGAALTGASIPIFQRRDVGSGLLTWGRRTTSAVRVASRNVLLRLPFTEGLWEQRVGLAAWVVSTFLLGSVMISVTKSVADGLLADPHLAALFKNYSTGSVYAGLLGLFWFGIALLLLAGYAVVQVSRWSAQDQEGRVEMLLSAPISRTRVVIERALEFAVASLLIVIGGYVGVASKAPSAGLNLDAVHVFTASALLWPFALAFGGLGVAVASRWPRIAVPFLAAFAVIEYILGDLAPLFKLPGWMANLSIFHLYGNPVVGNLSWTPAISMVLVFVAGFGAALVLMRQRDVSTA
jgi:ABC-2 type transport system permease protein